MVSIGLLEKKRIVAAASVLAGLAIFLWTSSFGQKILAVGLKTMPIISIGTLVSVILFWAAFRLWKSQI